MTTDPLARAGCGSVRTVARRLSRILESAPPSVIADGSAFYPLAGIVADDLGHAYADRLAPYGWTVTDTRATGAAILAALSPRQQWSANVSTAYAYAYAGKVPAMALYRAMLQQIHNAITTGSDPVEAITSPSRPKVSAFARNIVGDLEPVTVDSWAAYAAAPKLDPSAWLSRAGAYAATARAYRLAARWHGLEPATAQAIVWTAVRTHHHVIPRPTTTGR